jgi:precorrin-4 methylase
MGCGLAKSDHEYTGSRIMTTALEALRELISALERYYAPGDSIAEAHSGDKRIEKALDAAYEVLNSKAGWTSK